MPLNVRPLHDRVIVRVDSPEKLSAGGIVLPDVAGEKPSQGEILVAGNGQRLDDGTVRPLSVKAGEHVIFSKHSGQRVSVNKEELLVMREDDLIGVIEYGT